MTSTTLQLSVAQIVRCTEAEGPGKRFAIWLQGCPLRCPGCCNPEMLPFAGGESMTVDALAEQIRRTADADGLEGVTFLGGEPFAHADGLSNLALRVRRLGLSVMIFSGYPLEDLRATPDDFVAALLRETDILVDGPYLREQPETRRRWIGSRNQRVHFLTDRCRPDDPRWNEPNTLEVRLERGEITVNGFPAKHAVSMWKRVDVRAKR